MTRLQSRLETVEQISGAMGHEVFCFLGCSKCTLGWPFWEMLVLTNLKEYVSNVATLTSSLGTPKQDGTSSRELLSKLSTLQLPGKLRRT